MMNRFSIGRAFSETFAFLGNNWLSMLLWIGGAVLLIALLFGVMVGGNLLALGTGDPNDPTAVFAMFGRLMLFAAIAMVIVYGVGMIIWRNGLAPDASSGDIGWALLAGSLYALAMFVIMIAVYVLLSVVIGIVFVAVGVGAGNLFALDRAPQGMSGGIIAAMIAGYLVVVVALLWFQGRLMVAGPTMADRRMTNPFAAIAQSWRMTGPVQWRLLGFLIVFSIATYAVVFVLMIIGRTLVSVLTSDVTANIAFFVVFALAVYLPMLLLWLSMPAGVYRALGGDDDSAEVFA